MYHERGSIRPSFLCDSWVYVLNGYHLPWIGNMFTSKDFWSEVFMLIKRMGIVSLSSWRDNLKDVFGFLNYLGSKLGLGEDPILFEAWCFSMCGWVSHQWLTKCSMSHDQPILNDQGDLSVGYDVTFGLNVVLEMKDIRLKIFTCGWFFGTSSLD